MDTVFGPNHPFQEPRYLDENTLNGPGVADLKGGLVVMLKALEAFERSPWAGKLGWEVLINPDEEIGSQGSDFLLKEAASRNQIGLLFEPAYEESGTLAGDRRGSGNFTIVVRGKAAHAGRAFHEGRNAIVAAATLIEKLSQINGSRENITLNIGRIEGGGALNMVPELAIFGFNIRTHKPADEAWVTERIHDIISSLRSQNEITVELHGTFTRTPRTLDKRHQQLFDFVLQSAKSLGLTLAVKPSGGCCDGNNLSAYGLPNVDTLGVRGGAIHSEGEYVRLESLPERAKLAALLLMRLASGEVKI